MRKNKSETLAIEDAKIMFRNFSGAEGKYNPAGRRNFCVLLDTPIGEALEKDGWNVRWLDPREEGDEPQAYLPVAVSYDNIPPKIVMITSGNKTIMDESTINILDWAEIDYIDLIINPYHWDVNGSSGIKAYVKSMYVTIVEDEFASKYKDVPDSAQTCIGDECD